MLSKDTREAMLTRQLDFIPMDTLGKEINIVGAGAIGSWVALSLAKMGFVDITVWDDDEVSIENMNCQFYPISMIGRPKVDALADMVSMFTGTQIQTRRRYEGQPLNGIVISALDNMATRRLIFDKRVAGTTWIIDPRMSLEAASLFNCNVRDPASVAAYDKTFYSDSEAVQERCTAKSTIYTANLIAGLVCKSVKDIATDGKADELIRNAEWHIGKNQLMAWQANGTMN